MDATRKLEYVTRAATVLLALWDSGSEETHNGMVARIEENVAGSPYSAGDVVSAIAVLAECLSEF